MDPIDIVRSGYDKVSWAYRANRPDESSEEYLKYAGWTDELKRRLPASSCVLDLGCGCGVPVSQVLATDHRVTGVDISPVQVDRARRLVPEADFMCADMCEVEFPDASFDAVVCLYAIIHVPVDEQPSLIGRIARWLAPGGLFLVTAGETAWTGVEEDWLGVPGGDMYWSHADRATYRRWLIDAGFTVVCTAFIPEGDGGHSLFLLRKE